jgi:hypothetical protein
MRPRAKTAAEARSGFGAATEFPERGYGLVRFPVRERGDDAQLDGAAGLVQGVEQGCFGRGAGDFFKRVAGHVGCVRGVQHFAQCGHGRVAADDAEHAADGVLGHERSPCAEEREELRLAGEAGAGVVLGGQDDGPHFPEGFGIDSAVVESQVLEDGFECRHRRSGRGLLSRKRPSPLGLGSRWGARLAGEGGDRQGDEQRQAESRHPRGRDAISGYCSHGRSLRPAAARACDKPGRGAGSLPRRPGWSPSPGPI